MQKYRKSEKLQSKKEECNIEVKKRVRKGCSSNYLEVTVKEKVKQNSIKKVKIISYKNNVLAGEIV